MVKSKQKPKQSNFSGTIEFEDHGQDFLTWKIEKGEVVDSEPFQAWVWKGTLIHNEIINPGDILLITSTKIGFTTLKYPVAKVKVAK